MFLGILVILPEFFRNLKGLGRIPLDLQGFARYSWDLGRFLWIWKILVVFGKILLRFGRICKVFGWFWKDFFWIWKDLEGWGRIWKLFWGFGKDFFGFGRRPVLVHERGGLLVHDFHASPATS